MRLAFGRDVVGEAAAAGQQGLVLDAADRLAAAESSRIEHFAHGLFLYVAMNCRREA